MKRIILMSVFALVAMFSFKTASATVIGKMVDGVPQITINKENVLQRWNEFLLADGNIDARLENLEIVKRNGDEGDKYLLIAKGREYKSSILIEFDEETGSFMFTNGNGGVIGGGTLTCTTKACSTSSGCEAYPISGCSPCKGDCSKSTTCPHLCD